MSLNFGVARNTYKHFFDIDNRERPGIAAELTLILCESLRYNCKFTGIDNPNWQIWEYSFNFGVLANIFNQTFDGTLPFWLYTRNREENFSFIRPGVPMPYAFATRKCRDDSLVSLISLLTALNGSLLLYILLAIILLSLLVFYFQHKNLGQVFSYLDSFLNVFIHISIFIIRKGLPLRRLTSRANFLLTIWGLSAILFTASYSGGLTSSMFQTFVKPPFYDLPSLGSCLKQHRCRLVLQQEDNWFKNLLKQDSVEFYPIKETLDENPPINVPTYKAMFDLVEKTSNAFLVTEIFPLTDIFEMNITTCRLHLVNVPQTAHFIFQKNHKFLAAIEEKGKWIDKSGLIKFILNKYVRKLENCDSPLQPTRARPVPLSFVTAALILLMIGFGAATSWLIFEIITFS